MITTTVLNPAVDKVYFVDNFQADGLYRVRNVVKSAGGKGINVARVASLLGEKAASVGFKAGGTGEWLEAQLKGLGVHTSFIEVEGESRTNNNIIDRTRGTETEVLEVGPWVSPGDMDRLMESCKGILASASVLVCSGGLPEGVPTDIYGTLIEMARTYGVRVILDTSNEMLEKSIKAKPYMVKPNLRELRTYAGRELHGMDEIIGACREIVSGGVKVVVASMGGDGALLVSDGVVLHAEAPEVSVVNTIGSGDSMVAGLAVGLTKNYSPEEMLRLGMACAVANTQYREIGFVSPVLVGKYSKEIKIKRL